MIRNHAWPLTYRRASRTYTRNFPTWLAMMAFTQRADITVVSFH